MKDFFNWLKEILPLWIAFWSGKISAYQDRSKIEDENIKKDIDFADNISDDDFIELLRKKNK